MFDNIIARYRRSLIKSVITAALIAATVLTVFAGTWVVFCDTAQTFGAIAARDLRARPGVSIRAPIRGEPPRVIEAGFVTDPSHGRGAFRDESSRAFRFDTCVRAAR